MGTGMITILASAIIVNPCMLYGDEFAEPMAREMANYKVRVTYDPNLNRDCLDAYTLELDFHRRRCDQRLRSGAFSQRVSAHASRSVRVVRRGGARGVQLY